MTTTGNRTRGRLALVGWAVIVFVVAWLSGRRVAEGPGLVTRAYDVRDLLLETPDFTNAPRLGIGLRLSSTTQPAATTLSVEQRLGELASLIRARVAADTWGSRGRAVTALAGRLIVTQTADVHEQVRTLLRDLRDAREAQITVETRFITIDDAAAATLPESLQRRLAIVRAGAGTEPSIDGAPLTLPEEVALVLKKSNTLTAPRITLFSGQRAYVMTGTQTAYVADVTVSRRADGSATTQASIDVAQAGVVLDLHALASPDHRRVTLTLQPQLARMVSIEPSGPIPLPGTNPVALHRPTVDLQMLRTTVSLESGSTVLVGAFGGPAAWGGAGPSTRPGPAATEGRTYLLVKATVVPAPVDDGRRVFPRTTNPSR
jgi:hypothetical protein